MNPARLAFPIGATLAVIGVGYFFFWPWRERPTLPPEPVPAVARPAPAAPSAPQHPLAAEPAELPPLNQSDASILQALAGLATMDSVARVLRVEDLIRNIVATVDNLPREEISQRVNPLQPASGLPVVTGNAEHRALAPANAQRYTLYVTLFEAADTQKLAAVYRRFYPLFQQAYVDLGYPNGYFNDRLVAVIDHLVEAPEPRTPPRLVQPKVLYEFADPDLEALSAGQKAMIRLGPEYEARVKAKLKEVRAAIAR